MTGIGGRIMRLEARELARVREEVRGWWAAEIALPPAIEHRLAAASTLSEAEAILDEADALPRPPCVVPPGFYTAYHHLGRVGRIGPPPDLPNVSLAELTAAQRAAALGYVTGLVREVERWAGCVPLTPWGQS